MTKINFISVFIAFALLACSAGDKVPEEVLNEEKMINVIVDLEINQAMYKLKYANKDTVDFNQLAQRSFEQNNTTKEQFNESITFYAKHPKKMESIYDRAIILLSQKQAEVQRSIGDKD